MGTILIAGGAGFIGSHLSESLLKDGYAVICLDNFLTSDKNNISHLLANSKFTLVDHDVTKPLPKEIYTRQPLYVFHLASPASPNKKSKRSYIAYPLETLLVNSLGTYNLLELAKRLNARFLFASSSEIYGNPLVFPQNEEYFGNVNPNGIRSPYDEGKRFGEAITFTYVRKYNLDARIVRIFNTYGPRMQKDDGRVVSNFITQALAGLPLTIYGDGGQTRSFCYIDDMVLGLKKAIFTQNTEGEVINLGNPDERRISELATIVKDMTKSSSKITFEPLPKDDPKGRRPNIQKAKDLLGWQPNIVLVEGLKQTIKYFREI